MVNRKCPSCNCNIGKLDTTCPRCGELIFEEPVEVSEEKIKFKTFRKADSVSFYKKYLEKGHAIS